MVLKLFCALVLCCSLVSMVLGHGYIKDPAARNVCRQYGFPKCGLNYTPDEQNCGAFGTQWNKNKGNCGVCGDPYHLEIQRHVYPGTNAKGVITGTYRQGQEITVKIEITTNHYGWFEFRIGDIGAAPITQDKLSHLLKLSSGETRWKMTSPEKGEYTFKLQLPTGLICDHCVLQWWWKTGNSWDCDADGCGLGHGPQETFVNCADVKIV